MRHFLSALVLATIIQLALQGAPLEAATPENRLDAAAAKCAQLIHEDFSEIQDAPARLTKASPVPAKEGLQSYCQLQGYVAPQVGFELRLPMGTWNGRFIEIGCGGFCGTIYADRCNTHLAHGFACIASDMGHKGSGDDVLWARDNIQAQIDFGYRATHVAAVAGKAIAARFYGVTAKRSYFVGCSTGGYQGVTEAHRFPWDFDGIIAGAPDIDQPAAYLRDLWVAAKFQDEAGRPRLSHEALVTLHQAALSQCDLDDGVKDGIISDPMACHVDPKQLICKSGQTSGCLTEAQAETARQLYSGPMTSKGVKTSTGGYLPGSELTWAQPWPLAASADFFKYGMLGYLTASNWTYSDFSFDEDFHRFGMAPWYENSNPDLRQFKQAGGKLIIYHGGNDTVDLPGAVIDYYETVERTMGGADATLDFARLFLIPGMQHCTGGDGAFAIDYFAYLQDWVENGHAPEKIVGAHIKTDDIQAGLRSRDQQALQEFERRTQFPLNRNVVQFSRPIYPFPKFAKYNGSGSQSEQENFHASGP